MLQSFLPAGYSVGPCPRGLGGGVMGVGFAFNGREGGVGGPEPSTAQKEVAWD